MGERVRGTRQVLESVDKVSAASGCVLSSRLHFFFFQAEDGIRDYKVTGVQTCALPISQAGFEPGMFGPGELSGRSNAQPGPSCDRLRKMFGVVRNGDQT